MKSGLLLIGKSPLLVDDMRKRITTATYNLRKCGIDVDEVATAISEFEPRAVVLTLSHESKQSISEAIELNKLPQYARLPLLIVGSKPDCVAYASVNKRKNVYTILRPLNDDKFFELLEAVTSKEPEEVPTADESSLISQLVKELGPIGSLSGKKHILVVDDDPVMLGVIKSYLEDTYEVSIVTSGQQALNFLEMKKCDLVLLDYVMPEELGPTVLRKIRDKFSGEQLPVIFLTGISDRDLIITGMKQNPQDYLLKPIAKDVLLERIARQFK